MPCKSLAAFQRFDLHQKAELYACGPRALEHVRDRECCTARGKNVVDDEDALTRDATRVKHEFRCSVLDGRIGFKELSGQLAFLAHHRHAHVEALRDHRGKDESAGIDAHDDVDRLRGSELRTRIPEQLGVREDGGDVVEQDARYRKVGERLKVIQGDHLAMVPRAASGR